MNNEKLFKHIAKLITLQFPDLFNISISDGFHIFHFKDTEISTDAYCITSYETFGVKKRERKYKVFIHTVDALHAARPVDVILYLVNEINSDNKMYIWSTFCMINDLHLSDETCVRLFNQNIIIKFIGDDNFEWIEYDRISIMRRHTINTYLT